jgi:hypothetical protein
MATRREVESIKSDTNGLCKLARILGYKDPCSQLINSDGSVVGDLLYFLEDNPGACEAIVDWVLENSDLEEEEEDSDG